MKCCVGVWRKIAFLPLITLVVGWVVYLVGFCLTITSEEASNVSRFDYIAHFISIATNPLVVLLATLHTALFGRPSSILGLFAALLSVVCFPAVGYVLYINAVRLYAYGHGHGSVDLDAKSVVSFAGCLLISLSWTAVLVFWNCFTYKEAADLDDDDYAVDEEGTMDPAPSIPKSPPYFAGVARKLAAVFLVLQLGSWCLFVAGIDTQISELDIPIAFEIPFSFDVWVASTIGLLLIVCAFVHAAARGSSKPQLGTITYLLSMLYLVSVGHRIFFLTILIYHQCVDQSCSITDFPRYEIYQLCGGFGTCVFWGVVLGLRPFYFRSTVTMQDLRVRIRQQRRYLFQNERNEQIPLVYQSTNSIPPPSAPPLL